MSNDTLVFIPAWNEEENLPAVLDELHRELPDADVLVVDDGSTDRTADGRAGARRRGALVRREPRPARGDRRRLRLGARARATRTAAGSTPTASTRRPSCASCSSSSRPTSADVAVGSRFVSGPGYEPYRYEPEGIRKLGTGLLRRSMKVALGRPFNDATSGLYAASAKALPALSQPYESGAPEVEAVLRLHDAGLRVAEVPVDMRERASGESKLQGKKALLLVVTVIGTLLTARRFWRR